MNEKMIADVLREIADEAPLPGQRGLAERAWRAGRRRRRAGLGAAGLGVAAAVAAATITPLATAGTTRPASPSSAARTSVITLRSPIELAPVLSVTPGRCGHNGYPADNGRTCVVLSRSGTITVRELRSDGVVGSPYNNGYMVLIRFLPHDALRLGILTTQLYRDYQGNSDRGDLALLYRGQIVMYPRIDGAISGGELQVFPFFTRAQAEAFRRSLGS